MATAARTRTEIIKFNVGDRGRVFRGQGRHFDKAALANLINSPAVQEKVAHGDCLGYYGHWPRVKFGLNVPEGAIVNGKQVNIEPAVRTVHLKAYPDGTIEHQTEFLDNTAGRVAERLYKTQAGGFSSAISAPRRGASQVADGFFGFDYVLEPNYTKNRGYTLDGVEMDEEALEALSDEECDLLDDVAQYNELLDSTNAMLDRMQGDYEVLDSAHNTLKAEYEQMVALVNQVAEENNDLIGMLAKKGETPVKLDAVLDVVHVEPNSRYDQAEEFFDVELPTFVDEEQPAEKPVKGARVLDKAQSYFKRRWGI